MAYFQQEDLLIDDYSLRNHPHYVNPTGAPQVGLGIQWEVLNFTTTDQKKRSVGDCWTESLAYDAAMADLGYFKPTVDFKTGELISVNQRYNFWPDPNEAREAQPASSTTSQFINSPFGCDSPRPQSSARFSPNAAQVAIFPQFGNPRPHYAPITGTGTFYERIEPTAAQLMMASNLVPGAGYASARPVATRSYLNNSNDDNSYETSSVSSSSYLHDSPSELDLNNDAESSDTDSNAAAVDDNDSTSQYSSDDDDDDDSNAMAQRAVNGQLGEDFDNEAHFVPGNNIQANGEVIRVGTTAAKPKIAFHQLKKSPVASMLPEFLAQMEAANEELEAEKAAGTLASRRIEIDDDNTRPGPFIEMNLGLGVLEEVGNTSSIASDSDGSESGHDIMEKLTKVSHKRRRDDYDADDEISQQKKIKLIQEL